MRAELVEARMKALRQAHGAWVTLGLLRFSAQGHEDAGISDL